VEGYSKNLNYTVTSVDSYSEVVGDTGAQRLTCAVDLDGDNFSLVVETQDAFTQSTLEQANEGGDYDDEVSEPVLILPVSSITPGYLSEALHGMDAGILRQFLVEQSTDNLDS
jgi:hypothetical protein